MKRHDSIKDLSRDHHFGLLFCWKIRQGIHKHIPAERIKLYVEYFWIHHLKQHFEEEETLLFATLTGDVLCRQAISEHETIKELIESIRSANPASAHQLHLLAESLDKHIRFEERVLFPHLEQSLSDIDLNGIGNSLHELHEIQKTDIYKDAFWL